MWYNIGMIYLDHAAATPVSEKVFRAMRSYFSDEFFNPSSPYLPAKKVAHDYENAKSVIARAIGAKGSDLVITAGATEANNLAFTALNTGRVLSSQLPPPYSPDGSVRRGSPQLGHPSALIFILV